MNTIELLRIRLYNQLLSVCESAEPQDIVSRMRAMQSQSLDLAKWAIGVRLQGKNVQAVNEALDTGKIIRTHILRPTWHFVSVKDLRWMFDLSNPRLKPIYQSYCKMLGADESFIYRGVSIVEKALSEGEHLTKQEIGDFLQRNNFIADTHQLTLIISYAEMDAILCNGKQRGNKQTFTSLDKWVTDSDKLHKEEALARLATCFFTSHGPATMEDFTWWSGLRITECRDALSMVKDKFIAETVNGRTFYLPDNLQIPPVSKDSALLLPPFDEFVVSYKDRSELIDAKHYGKVMTKNGLFSPTIMLNGKIIGSWKKTVQKGKPQVALTFFEKTPLKIQKLYEPEIKRVEEFYGCF